MADRLTLATVREALAPLGLTIARTGYGAEVRVRFREREQRTGDDGHFTDDLKDALDTGRAMAAHRAKETTANV